MMDTKITQAGEFAVELTNEYATSTGEVIGYEKGAKMVKNYYDATHNIKSHFIGREMIEAILSQPGAAGINILYGRNENGNNQPIMLGVDTDGKYILNFTTIDCNGELSKQKGMITMGGVRSPGTQSCGWFE